MDREPTLNELARRIRDCLRAYAKSKGWILEDFRLLMNVETEWFVIMLVVFAREFLRIGSDQIRDEMQYYNEIMDRIEAEFADEPDVPISIGLLLRPLDEYYQWGYRGPVDNTIEIDDQFMNQGLDPEKLRGPIGSKL